MHQIIDRARYMEPKEIEAKAEGLLHGFEKHVGRPLRIPIEVSLLAEGYLDLSIDWTPIPDDAEGPILAYIDPARKELRMNSGHQAFFEEFLGSESFTLAHEVGHWVLHVQVAEARQLSFADMPALEPFVCRLRRTSNSSRLEWQADQFAASLLMPEAMIRRYVAARNIHGWGSLYAMKNAFGVTPTALKRRLKDLKLLYISDDGLFFPNQEAHIGQTRFV